MILFLILLVLLAIAGKMFLGMAMWAVGIVLGLVIVLAIAVIRRGKRR